MLKSLNSFIIKNIERESKNHLALIIQIEDETKNFTADFIDNSVSFPDGLEEVLMHRNFDYHRKFLKILNEFNKGITLEFPIVIFDYTKIEQHPT